MPQRVISVRKEFTSWKVQAIRFTPSYKTVFTYPDIAATTNQIHRGTEHQRCHYLQWNYIRNDFDLQFLEGREKSTEKRL